MQTLILVVILAFVAAGVALFLAKSIIAKVMLSTSSISNANS